LYQQEEHPVDSGIKIDNCQVSQYSDAPDVAVDEVHHGAEMYVRRWISLREYIQDEVHGVMPDPQDISG
jgi:nucleolar pre-ribosomal-associated protein 1